MDCGSRPPRSQLSGVRVVAKLVDHCQLAEAQGSDGDPASMCVSFTDDGHALVSICPEAKYTRNAERSVYELDYCYEEERGVDEIYAIEIRPLVEKLFDGTNCCVISYGAQQSWPAQLFQGSGENPSLAEITISEILHKNGEGVEISDYEVFRDQIYDLLETKEEGVQLKSLSKVKVNTVDEFRNFYCKSDRLMRGHRGLIIYISDTSKLNFLELGGYGGATDNKSLYAVMQIVYALNSKNHISYRDSKLTHQLHNFLSWESQSVVIACLSRSNNQRNMRSLRLASSSSQVANIIQFNTIRRPAKQYATPLERRYSMSVPQIKPIYGKVNRCASVIRAVKNFGLVKEKIQSDAAKSMAKLRLVSYFSIFLRIFSYFFFLGLFTIDGVYLLLFRLDHDLVHDKQVEMSISEEVMHRESTDSQSGKSLIPGMQQEVDHEESHESGITNPHMLGTQQENITGASELQECNDMHEETTSDNSTGEVGMTLALLTETSPKVSDRLREISNSLFKLFPNSEKPAHIGTPKRVSFSSCTVEAKTPNASSFLGFGDSAIADMPPELIVTRTTDMKKSLKKGCLTYINSANKEELKRLKGIGEVRANRILQLRDNNPEPFKDVEDLKNIGITPRQFDKMWMNFIEDC
ncbi:kinesin-like protein KIN-10B isoform X2 [Carex rostrata]